MRHAISKSNLFLVVLLLLLGSIATGSSQSHVEASGLNEASPASQQRWMAYCNDYPNDHVPAGVWRSRLCYPSANDAWHLARQHDLLYRGHGARAVPCP